MIERRRIEKQTGLIYAGDIILDLHAQRIPVYLQSGKSDKEVAAIMTKLNGNGNGNHSKTDITKVKSMKKTGISNRAIAKELGVSEITIRRMLSTATFG